MVAKSTTVAIVIPELKKRIIKVPILGMSDLIVDRFTWEKQQEILDKQTGAPSQPKKPKDPIADVVNALYFIDDAIDREPIIAKMKKDGVKPRDEISKYFKKIDIGFPAIGFKKCIVNACRIIGDKKNLPMTLVRNIIHVFGDAGPVVKVSYKKLWFRQDNVRLQGTTADIRHRPCLEGWSATLTVQLNLTLLPLEQAYNLINHAGSGDGVGNWRPEKNGVNGLFELKKK